MASSVNENLLVVTVVSVRPYLYEIPHILAPENGATFKFRFRDEWIPTEERAKLEKHARKKKSVDKDALQCLIVYRHETTGAFLPVRHATVVEISLIGKVYYIRVSLSGIPEIESDEDARRRQFLDFQTKHEDAVGQSYPNTPNKPLHKLIFFTSDAYLQTFHNKTFKGRPEDLPFDMWDSLFQKFSALPEFAEIDFFKIIGVFGTSGRKCELAQKPTAMYRLGAGALYSLRIYQRRPASPAQPEGGRAAPVVYTVALKVDDQVVRVLDGEQPVLGRYDVLEFFFRALDTGAGQLSFLIVHLNWKNDKHSDALRKFSLPVYVGPRRRDAVLTLIFVAVLISLFFQAHIATWTGLTSERVASLQTFVLFLLGVSLPHVQRVFQSMLSKLFRV